MSGPSRQGLRSHAASRSAGDSAVMLQGFHWLSWQSSPWWGAIASKAQDIAASGFSMVWLPPSEDAASNEGYIPGAGTCRTRNTGPRPSSRRPSPPCTTAE